MIKITIPLLFLAYAAGQDIWLPTENPLTRIFYGIWRPNDYDSLHDWYKHYLVITEGAKTNAIHITKLSRDLGKIFAHTLLLDDTVHSNCKFNNDLRVTDIDKMPTLYRGVVEDGEITVFYSGLSEHQLSMKIIEGQLRVLNPLSQPNETWYTEVAASPVQV